MSLKEASGALFLHKNTLQYHQLDRIWRETGYDPRSFQDAVILYLGLKLLP
ncbi:MAG: PucR family transcriptional regulator [Clostridiales bacterium]|nr:PucR family transcriptional regulator [Clostridiales bacterium]